MLVPDSELTEFVETGIQVGVNGVIGYEGGSNDRLIIYCSTGPGGAGYRMTWRDDGNVTLGTASSPATGGVPCFTLAQTITGTNPSSIASNTAVLFAKDVGGTAELFGMDEGGTATQLTKHAADGPPWLYDADDEVLPDVDRVDNAYIGYTQWVNNRRFRRLSERQWNGEDISKLPKPQRTCEHIEWWPPQKREDWDQNQEIQYLRREAERAEYAKQKADSVALLEQWTALPEGHPNKAKKPLIFIKPEPAPYIKKPIPVRLKDFLEKQKSTK